MKVQGKLKYAPQALATGKKRTSILCSDAQELMALMFYVYPSASGKQLRYIRRLLNTYASDPHLWNPKRELANKQQAVEELYANAQAVLDSLGGDPESVEGLSECLENIHDNMILTKDADNWAILELDNSVIDGHVASLRRKSICLSKSVWGTHCTVIRGETFSGRPREGDEFSVLVADKVRHNSKGYYWLEVKSQGLEDLRESMGLSPRPKPSFHITLGKRT
jgi:hypothetical protein